MNPASTITILLLGAPVFAQSVSATVTTSTPILARAYSSVFGITQQYAVPASTSGYQLLNAGWGGSLAISQWDAFAHDTEARIYWQQRAEVFEPTPSFADAGGELLAQLSAPTPTPVQLELSRILSVTTGASTPFCSIDLGDDGIPEVTSWTSVPVLLSTTLGPQPLPIRLRSFVGHVGLGVVDVELRIRVLPGTAPSISPLVIGCTGPAGVWAPTFVGEGVVFYPFSGLAPLVLVLGLGLQPVVIPASLPTPCLLLPTPDLLVVPGLSPFFLPLPPAVRPVTVWVQGVAVTPTGLATTDGFTVIAF
ncbi:MAG TPA: hypothetical protein VFD82_24790 [Planctomycetota bacterium]|nr:hypothetical protein [Planctomycetota bacterium]